MRSISVDLDISEFSDEEILRELNHRLLRKGVNKEYLLNKITVILKGFTFYKTPDSLECKMKIDYLLDNIEKIKIDDLENIKR